ncbi:phasin family protein [Thermophilibacter mediterraneus]|uniref:phasin family protein n=1 Tax=Thermophilibacter mediterraneus TaxID=1871031 RepID=UPI0009315837|nr:hypothetical protein [Thermophilibacter mediterraneus]
MSEFDVTEGLKKLFLASVGAVAMGAEKSQEVVDELVKKGELTVEQGKTLNQELTRKAKEVIDGTSDRALRARLEAMTPEERAAYAAKVAEMSADIDAQTVKVDVEEPAGEDEADAK